MNLGLLNPKSNGYTEKNSIILERHLKKKELLLFTIDIRCRFSAIVRRIFEEIKKKNDTIDGFINRITHYYEHLRYFPSLITPYG